MSNAMILTLAAMVLLWVIGINVLIEIDPMGMLVNELQQ